jgi:hypothetical protein
MIVKSCASLAYLENRMALIVMKIKEYEATGKGFEVFSIILASPESPDSTINSSIMADQLPTAAQAA